MKAFAVCSKSLCRKHYVSGAEISCGPYRSGVESNNRKNYLSRT